MEGGPLLTDRFARLAERAVPFLPVTTRIPDREGDDLLFDLGGSAFPTIYAIDAGGEVVGAYEGASLPGMEELVERAMRYVALREAGDDARPDAAILSVLLGRRELWEVEEELGEVSGERLAALEEARATVAVREVAASLPRMEPDDAHAYAAREFLPLYRRGAFPAGYDERTLFWGTVLREAERGKDASMLADALERARPVLDEAVAKEWEARLAALEGE